LESAAFKLVEDRAVNEAIAMQEDVDLDVITDGELRRFSFLGPLTETVSGIGPTPSAVVATQWHGESSSAEIRHEWPVGVIGKLELRRSLVVEEFAYARGRTSKPIKVTLPSPMMMTNLWHPEASSAVYDDIFALFEDAAAIIRHEVAALAEIGCKHIQIDAPEFAKLVDDEGRRWHAKLGAPAERLLSDGIALLNTIPAGIDGVTFAVHLCRGNNQGFWRSSGGYEAISKEFFRRATAFHGFFLEYDDERSGGFEPLSDVPDDKFIVLGLVTTKRARLESAADLIARIEAASRHFPQEQLAISPQCGFASDLAGNPLTESHQRAKLSLVHEVAHRVWG
jgi:5-methyltetrahydropteroyltriglutamate--homocysteine methyltransferase